MRTCMEKRLVLVRKRYVDHHRYRESQESISQRTAQFPRIVRCEVFED
jgi:hypothetical protein